MSYTKEERKVFKELKAQIKADLKQLVDTIRTAKPLRKPYIYSSDATTTIERDLYNRLFRFRMEYRHMHIAYCMFFNGTPYAVIESPSKYNKPSNRRIDKYRDEWQLILERSISEIEDVETAEAA